MDARKKLEANLKAQIMQFIEDAHTEALSPAMQASIISSTLVLTAWNFARIIVDEEVFVEGARLATADIIKDEITH